MAHVGGEALRSFFEGAMRQWEAHTCLRFEEADNEEVAFLHYRTDKQGCFSFVGKQVKDLVAGQDVNLGKGCEKARKWFNLFALFEFHSN